MLFAITDPHKDNMHLIDVHPHKGAFTNQGLIRIIEAEWPEVLSPYKLRGLSVENSGPRSDEDIREDRKHGLTSITVTPSGDVLAPPGGGITTACTSVTNQLAADRQRKKAIKLQEKVEQSRSNIEERFKKDHDLTWADLDIHLTSFVLGFIVTEARTGETLRF